MKVFEEMVERKYGKYDHHIFFFRCTSCHSLVGSKMIMKGGCKCHGSRMSPAVLTFWEEIKIVVSCLW